MKKKGEIVLLPPRSLVVLNKAKIFLPNSAMYQLYCTQTLPYLNYSVLLWGNDKYWVFK